MSFITTPTTTVSFTRQTRTSNTQLTASNLGQLIYITSGTFTQTFAACASLGSGWYAYIENAGTGNITLDPFGSETIDGLTSFIMYPGEVRLIQTDGVNLISIVLNAFNATFTASGTFTKPPGYSQFSGYVWGAGGSGARTNDPSIGSSGGGGGACLAFTIQPSFFGATETITIGSGGAAVTGVSSGSAGGNSSIGSLIISYGGGAGRNPSPGTVAYGGGGGGVFSVGPSPTTANLAGGSPALLITGSNVNNAFGGGDCNGNLSVYGGGGGGLGTSAINVSSPGGRSLYGGGGGASLCVGVGCPAENGGASTFGGAGGGVGGSAANGLDGTAPGGGGGATHTGTTSGAGARGEIRIWGIV